MMGKIAAGTVHTHYSIYISIDSSFLFSPYRSAAAAPIVSPPMFSHPDDDNDDDPFLIFSPCASLDEPSVHYVDAHLQFLIIEMRAK
jgi:hypothetical protein